MSDANPTSEAGAGAEALLGLAAQAGHAVRLPSLPSIAKQHPVTHPPFLPAPPSLSLPTQSQPPSATLQTSAQPTLPTHPTLPRDRLPTLSEWPDPAFRPFPPPLLAPLPDRWQNSAPVPPPPSQYPYHNPWQSYPYPPPYYYYQQQNLPYPVPHQPSVAPVPPPLALPTPPVVPPLRVSVHTDPVRDAAATNSSSAFPPPIPQTHTVTSRDPLLERLTNEAAAAPKKAPSRARGLADLMNPTDTIPGSSEPAAQSRMDLQIFKPETIETKVTPVTVPSVPSAEPKLTDIVKEPPKNTKLDLALIAGISTGDIGKHPQGKTENNHGEEKSQREFGDHSGTSKAQQQEVRITPERRQPHSDREMNIREEVDPPIQSSKEDRNQEDAATDSHPKENEQMRERKDDSSSQPECLEDEDEEEDEEEDRQGAHKEREDGENGEEETRCPCGSAANSGFMIACDQCNTWQHLKCMGFRRSTEVPEKYYCNICRPDDIRPTCVAHPKYKDRSNREKGSLDRRDYESQLVAVKPAELRKLFASDMRQKKTLLRSKGEAFIRYASLAKNQYTKHRSSVIDGLMILLDMQRQDVVERLDAAMRRLKSERQEDFERKRSDTMTPNEVPLSESGSTRTPGSSRGQTQKRARPHSLSIDGLEGTSGVRGESIDAFGDFDLGADASHGRNMSREERKLQQTMKLFARMEEREREKKRPRTGDVSASPRAGPPSRSRTPKPSSTRTVSPKPSAVAMDSEDSSRKGASESRQKTDAIDSPERKPEPTSETRVIDVARHDQQPEISQPMIVQPFPQQKSSLTSGSENDFVKKEKDQRKDRLERTAPRRKESCSPDNLNANTNGRRRSILARERSQESKRRRAGLSRESERRNSTSKEPLQRDSSLEFSVTLPGPSVIGSRKIAKTRLSKLEREVREKEEAVARRECEEERSNGNKKERLLEVARHEAEKKILNGCRSPSPMKKRYRRGQELREESDGNTNKEQGEAGQQSKGPSGKGKASETLSVSMVVVSEKGSLPDRGQILESTRLILPGANGKIEDATSGKTGTSKTACLKKRPNMLSANAEVNRSEDPNVSVKPTPAEKPVPKQSTTSKLWSPSSPLPQKSPSSPMHRVASPKLRSCPPPVVRSASFRSVPAEDARQTVRSPSPLPSFKSQKLSPSPRRQSQSPEAEKRQKEDIPSVSRKLSSGSSPGNSIDGKARRNLPDPTADIRRSGEQSKGIEESAPSASASKSSPDTKSIQSSAAPPPLRSIRSVPPPPKSVEQSAGKTHAAGREDDKDGNSSDPGQPTAGKRSSGGATISDIFQQRVQEFLRPCGASPLPSPSGTGPKYGPASPLTSPRPSTSHAKVSSPIPSVRGSAAKLGAALPLSSKPNLDGLRNSSGLSPRVSGSGSGHVYSRSYGPSFRSKPADDRPWNSVPSFSSLKRQHSFGRGSRGSSLIGGKPGSFSSVGRGRHSHGREGLSSYSRDDMMDKNRSGYSRDGPFIQRDEDKMKSGNPHSWNRSYAQRNGWGGSGPGHSSDGSGRGGRRGHHGS